MRIAGYAAIFDHPDRGGDIVRRGAFAQARSGLPLLWQHDRARRAGTVETLHEDARGLRIVARLAPGTPLPKLGHGLSFGYRVTAMVQRRFRELTALELVEISLVSAPMQPLAQVLAVEA